MNGEFDTGHRFPVPTRNEYQAMVSFFTEQGFPDLTIPDDIPQDGVYRYLMSELQEKPMRKKLWHAMSTLAEEIDEIPGAEEIRDMIVQALVVVTSSSDELTNCELGYTWTVTQAAADFLNHAHHRRHPSGGFLIDRNNMFAFVPSDGGAPLGETGDDWNTLISRFHHDAVDFFHVTTSSILRYEHDLSSRCERVNHYLSEAFHSQTVVGTQENVLKFLKAVDHAQNLPEIKSAIQSILGPNATYMTAIMVLDIVSRDPSNG